MALQKKNNLLRSHLIVAGFWFFILFFVGSGFSLEFFSSQLSYALMVVVLGTLAGAGTYASIDAARRASIHDNLGKHSLRGVNSTIGKIITADMPDRKKAGSGNALDESDWWASYKDKHPAHAKALLAVFEVMNVQKNLPASHVPGGHGGVSLIRHSMNVVKEIKRLAPDWRYTGHKKKNGDISFPLIDATKADHRFHPDDPILPLVAFAHDIGKVACYKMDGKGLVTRVKVNHDIEGVRMLRRLPEVMSLPWRERMPLLIACGYYHHIGSLPQSTWISDRARSLIELLILADNGAGKKEGNPVNDEYVEDGAKDNSAEVLPFINENSGIFSLDDGSEDGVSEVEVSEIDRSGNLQEFDQDSSIEITRSMLIDPGRVNGKSVSERIAWKYGEFLYISEFKLRNAIAQAKSDSSYSRLTHQGVMHPFTMKLMADLAARKMLLQEFNGKVYSEKRAIWNTRASLKAGIDTENKFVIVANVAAFPGLENIPDCKNAPEIVNCSWGETAAMNKNKKAPNEAPEGEGSASGQDDAVTQTNDESPLDANAGTSAPVLAPSSAPPTDGHDSSEYEESIVDLLRIASATLQIPFVEKIIDGKACYLFEEEIVKEVFGGADLNHPDLYKTVGGKTGKAYLGIFKEGKQ